MKTILTKLEQLEGKTIKGAKQAFHAEGDSYYFIVLETTDNEFAIIQADFFDYEDAGVKVRGTCVSCLDEIGLTTKEQSSDIESRCRQPGTTYKQYLNNALKELKKLGIEFK